MKETVKRNYYQKKNWDFVDLQRQVRDQEMRMTPEEKAANERETKAQWDQIYAKYVEMEAHTRIVRNPFAALLFRWATKTATVVAKHFEMNVVVEESDRSGQICFMTDQVLSERIWHDQKYRKQLLRLMRRADSLWIDTKEEHGQVLVQICLTYKTAIRINTKNTGF